MRPTALQPFVAIVAIVARLASGQQAEVKDCPRKCQCERREAASLVVRCMLTGLTQVPGVPRETSSLDLRLNQIKELTPEAFRGLDRLHTLLLNGNQLRKISADAFVGLSRLKYLYLYKNEIEFVHPRAFVGLPALELLYLHNNQLKTLSRGLFLDLPNLKRLRLDGNQLTCDCNLLWLRDLAEAADHTVAGTSQEQTPALAVTATCTLPSDVAGLELTAAHRSQFKCIQSTSVPQSQTTTRAPRPVSSTVIQPSPLYLKCLLEGGTFSHPTNPRILWYHNNYEVVTNDIEPTSKFSLMADGTLVVSGELPPSDDEFTCMHQNLETGQILNGNPQAIVDAALTTVQQTNAPKTGPITRAPRPVSSTIIQPSPLYLKCLLEGGTFSHPTNPRILWYHNNYEVVTNDVDPTSKFSLMSDGTLVVSGELPPSDDEFTCMHQNLETEQILNGKPQAIVDTGATTVQPTNAPKTGPITRAPRPVSSTVIQPSPLYLKCLLEGGTFSHPTNPRIMWYHNNYEVVTNDVEPTSKFSLMPDGTLVVSGPLPASDDEFSCMLQSPETGQVINGKTQAIIDTERSTQKPLFSAKPKDSVRPIGSSVIFHCAVSGPQPATISWTKDGAVVENTRFSSVLNNGSLYINQLTQESSGLYQCIADGGNNLVSQASAKLVVKDGPYFIEEPHNTKVLQDDTLYLRCEIGASLGALIQWRHNGTVIVESSQRALLNQGNVLRVMPATLQDAGWYTCGITVAQQTVRSKPAVVEVLRKEPPVFTLRQNPSSIDVEVGDDVELLCAATGQPAPVMSWWRGGRVIDFAATEGRVAMTPEGHLQIRRLTLSDSGAYVCRAENSVGVARAAAFLRFTSRKDYAGEKFVKDAVKDARADIDSAVSRTAKTLFNRNRQLSSSDLMALFKYPSDAALPIASAAEVFERSLELILKRVQESPGVDIVGITNQSSEISIRNILSPEHIRIIAELSGCDENKPVSVDCSDRCFHAKYRTIDGTCNNLDHPSRGASLTRLNRFMPPYYENNFNLPIGWNPSKLYHGFPKPSARLVSTTVIGANKLTYDNLYTHMLMQWGQFLDHDLDLSPQAISNARFADGRECNSTCENQPPCFPVMTPPGDPRIQHHRCMGVTRSSAVCGTGETSVFYGFPTHREQLNELTAYIDASQVYGSTPALARHLRDLAGDAGLLRSGLTLSPSKPLLPFNINAKMDCHIDPAMKHIPCFLAGEIRANEQLGLLSMHTIFVREHNRLAAELGRINRHWDGETVYQEARKIIGAVMQHVSYEHWLPKAVGQVGMRMLGPYGGYDPTADATIMNEFSTAAFRFGHTLIDPIMRRFDPEMREIAAGHLSLHRAFFSPFRLIEEGGVDPVLRGLFAHAGKLPTPDNVMNRELTERLFKLAHALAQDLASLNIQRGRDHGLPPYNDVREKCGLGRAQTFEDLAKEITDVDVRRKLSELYGHPGNVDLFVGAALEKMVEGSRMGPTFMCIIVEQFRRLRSGDRFFYEKPGVFSPEQLAEIKKASLSRILCDSGDNITLVPPDVFLLAAFPKGYVRCDSKTAVPGIDLRVWSECCEGCRKNNAGVSNAAAASATRRRRSVEPHSQYSARDAALTIDVETRIQGLEDAIVLYKATVDRLVKKLEMLEKSAGNQQMNSTNAAHAE